MKNLEEDEARSNLICIVAVLSLSLGIAVASTFLIEYVLHNSENIKETSCDPLFVNGTVVKTHEESSLFGSGYYIVVENKLDSSQRFNIKVEDPLYLVGDGAIIWNDYSDHWVLSSEEEKEEILAAAAEKGNKEAEWKKLFETNKKETKKVAIHYLDGASEKVDALEIVEKGKYYEIRVEEGARWVEINEVEGIVPVSH